MTSPTRGDDLLVTLTDEIPSACIEPSPDDDVMTVLPGDLAEFAAVARRIGFEMCVDITVVDYWRIRDTRFELVVNLLSLEHNRRLRIRVGVPESDFRVPSLTAIYPGADFLEREAYDMFGVQFDGHPDLTRILMPDDWEGHPLRRDFATGAVPVQFKASPQVT